MNLTLAYWNRSEVVSNASAGCHGFGTPTP
jgi:hypothetical protein